MDYRRRRPIRNEPPNPALSDEYGSWFTNTWRPAMAWQYLVVCLFDFLVAPVLMGIYSYITGDYHSWEPLTIRGGGLYHLSMGAVVGVAVWSRGKEKLMQIAAADPNINNSETSPVVQTSTTTTTRAD